MRALVSYIIPKASKWHEMRFLPRTASYIAKRRRADKVTRKRWTVCPCVRGPMRRLHMQRMQGEKCATIAFATGPPGIRFKNRKKKDFFADDERVHGQMTPALAPQEDLCCRAYEKQVTGCQCADEVVEAHAIPFMSAVDRPRVVSDVNIVVVVMN